MQLLLTLLNCLLKLLHPPTVLLELLAITPSMGRMLPLLLLEIPHQACLGQHFTSQVVLRRDHVMTSRHVSDSKRQAAARLVSMAQFPGAMQLRNGKAINLQTAELRMNAHNRLTGQQHPDVVVRETEQ